MVSIDLPTAFVAVFLSVLLTFWKDNINEFIKRRWSKRRKEYEERRDWLLELQYLAEEIEGFVLSTQMEVHGIEEGILPQVEEIQDDIEDINYREVQSLDDIVDKIADHENVQSNDIQLPLDATFGSDFQSLPPGEKREVVRKVTEELSMQIRESVRTDYYEALAARIGSELRKYSKRLNKHYAKRPEQLDEGTYEAFLSLKTATVSYSLVSTISENGKEHIIELVSNVFEETNEDLQKLEKERKLRNRIRGVWRN